MLDNMESVLSDGLSTGPDAILATNRLNEKKSCNRKQINVSREVQIHAFSSRTTMPIRRPCYCTRP
jgi:hypothetical protein